jgi:Protein involved in chromosome segregation, interacts with SMC proteins
MVNTRRITLGAISTNRRQSLAVGLDGPAKSSTRSRTQRMSMAPRMVGSSLPSSDRSSLTPGRRKSVGESHRLSSIPPPMTMRTENRPIGDKAYLNTCMKKLYQYLLQNDYEHPIKLKDLAKPSGKDFHSIMTFLMKKIDPNFNSSIKRKFEDDVVTAFKILGYPANISKTALVAAGSPHTWPTLLLALTWLIEVLEGRPGFDFILNEESEDLSHVGEAGVPFVDAETLEDRSEKAFLKYVEISYNSFLSGDDDLLEKLEVDLLQYFEKDNIMIEREIEKVVDDNNTVEEEISQIKKAGEE